MKVKELFQYILAIVLVVGIFVLLGVLIIHEIPDANKDLLNMVVGAIIVSFATVIGYFFGSSKGSADKNELLKNGK